MAQRHMKRSDVEAQKVYPFRERASSFQSAYPTVKSIRVEVRPSGQGFEPYRNEIERVDVYTENSFRATIDCRNPRCYNGSLELDHLVRWAVVAGKAHRVRNGDVMRGLRRLPEGTAERWSVRHVLQGEGQRRVQGRRREIMKRYQLVDAIG